MSGFKASGRLGPATIIGASAANPSPFSIPQGSSSSSLTAAGAATAAAAVAAVAAAASDASTTGSSSSSTSSSSSRLSTPTSSPLSAFFPSGASSGYGAGSIINTRLNPPASRRRPAVAAPSLPSCRASAPSPPVSAAGSPGPDPAPRQADPSLPAKQDSLANLPTTTASTTLPATTVVDPEPPNRARWAPAPAAHSRQPLRILPTPPLPPPVLPPPTPPRRPHAATEAFSRRLLPKRLARLSSSDDSSSCRPPVTTPPVRVPPIRALRSSSSRRHRMAPDMNFGSRLEGHRHRASDDTTLRALEGRDAADGSVDRFDDPADVFLRIARDESPRLLRHDSGPEVHQQKSPVRAVTVRFSIMRLCACDPSSAERRPFSTVVTGSLITSPPRPRRRLSDHQDRPRSSHPPDGQSLDPSRSASYRPQTRDKAASTHLVEDPTTGRTRAGSVGLRPASLIVRSPQVSFQEPGRDGSTYARRRASITESHTASRPSTSSGGVPQNKLYSSSPLVRGGDSHGRPSPEQGHHGLEGTDSTASTAGPSTVWDELDDIKSRIHRLELTGKLPSSSGTAGSRLSDERPPTATTTTTTSMSLSPKRQGVRSTEATVLATSPKEAHSVLNSTLAKMKPLVSADIYRALESAAQDAMGLSAMMGSPGQFGPISSGASTIGSTNTVTDRQLRRKADGVCRSLTELCVALGEGVVAQPGSARSAQPSTFSQLDGPSTPTLPRSYSGLPAPRRSSIAVDTGLPKSSSSPRALSRLEERRNNLLNGASLSSPRASAPPPPSDVGMGRRSSLMVGRTRRTGTEEPDEGRSTTLLRSRRAGTEEPDEGRKTSLLVRSRRGTIGAEADETRFGAPSRAATQIGFLRGRSGQDAAPTSPPEPNARSAAGLGRRPLASSTGLHTSRLATPSGSGPAPPRRYLERAMADYDGSGSVMRSVEDQPPPSRPPPLSQGISHLRASSLSARRQTREGMASSGASLAGYIEGFGEDDSEDDNEIYGKGDDEDDDEGDDKGDEGDGEGDDEDDGEIYGEGDDEDDNEIYDEG
ncbi:hypothetical protein CP532_1508 [Ophiocordyceps camponoti-leonardi (nom. inval.)]|nr:hypothetical protein CP532_1508 [Ophiocordyceps camponoti-leonardi (nom. inval.)]